MTDEPVVRALSGRPVGELTIEAIRRGELSVADLLRTSQGKYADSLVHWCYDQNKQ